jgi:hypothetical protein
MAAADAPDTGSGIAMAASLHGALRLDAGAGSLRGGRRSWRTNTICNDRKYKYASNSHHGEAPRLDFRIFLRCNGTAPGLPNATTDAGLV